MTIWRSIVKYDVVQNFVKHKNWVVKVSYRAEAWDNGWLFGAIKGLGYNCDDYFQSSWSNLHESQMIRWNEKNMRACLLVFSDESAIPTTPIFLLVAYRTHLCNILDSKYTKQLKKSELLPLNVLTWWFANKSCRSHIIVKDHP